MGIKLLNARDGSISSASLELFTASYDRCEAVLMTFSSANASRMRHLKLQNKSFPVHKVAESTTKG